jgi:hypothetical protein
LLLNNRWVKKTPLKLALNQSKEQIEWEFLSADQTVKKDPSIKTGQNQ